MDTPTCGSVITSRNDHKGDPVGELAIVVTSKARPGKREQIKDLYEELMAPRAMENQTQEVVVWCADQHDPDGFFLFEIYTDATAMGANAQADFFAEYMAKAGPLLAGEPSVFMGTPLWSKGV
jgi:quinol monooxygenase YgiN